MNSVRRLVIWAVVAAVSSAFLVAAAGTADQASEGPDLRRLEGVWLGTDARVHGWRYVTRYDVSITGRRLQFTLAPVDGAWHARVVIDV